VDPAGINNGTIISNAIVFGIGATGEGIVSKRTPGGNNNGLDFIVNSTPRISIFNNGNVGIGTDSPTSKLEVRGDVKLGNSGQFYAAGGEENLKIVRGVVVSTGTTLAGSGFTSVRDSTGAYTVTFTPAFSAYPAIVATAEGSASINVAVVLYSGYFKVYTSYASSSALVDNAFHFIAIGPR
jgi:hypothetical protein